MLPISCQFDLKIFLKKIILKLFFFQVCYFFLQQDHCSCYNHRVKNLIFLPGGVVEWFKALVLKTSVSARAPWVRIPPPPYLENLHRVSYPTIGRQNYFNRRYKAIFERFKKLSLVIVLHKQSDRGNYLLGDLLWDLSKITGGLNSK